MPDNPKQPGEYDAVLGGKNPPPVDGVVLGGLEGAKQRFASSDENYRFLALSQLINYRQEGWDLIIQALKDPSKRVQLAAYKLLRDISELKVKQAILEFNPYRFFECVYTIELNRNDAAIAIHPDGKTLVCCDAGGSSFEEPQRDGSIVGGTYIDFKKWDLKTGKSLRTITKIFGTRIKDHPKHLTFSSDAQTLAIGGSQHDSTIRTEIWNFNTEKLSHVISGQPLWESRLRRSNTLTAIALSSDGKILASGNEAGHILVWDLETKQNIYTIKGQHSTNITSLAIDVDARMLASASLDKTVKLWNLRRGSEIYTLVERKSINIDSCTISLAISPNGRKLITGDNNLPTRIRIWDFLTGNEVHTLFPKSGKLSLLTFSADGKIFVSCGGDINIWNLQTKELLAKLPDATSVAISPDGQTIVSYIGKLIRVWRVP
ncbi:MAG: WD40 repeat domain-containing protein [Nostoc sp. DedVER02]|uniref:WD40 repeat domain-containing protein n=1 Tax=unclassified Nostoc TaxID=2593658 RepID=UPI002AD2E979|nr:MULTISPECIES: WD40 repeat domain-containing protein [unclassified Nostoc]MDZ7984481.1 WD40 repeat domain-containing protein [Nostoc sp. DedVER02]MDZ8115572.1 WD40 repeat domain-containing protein [Nostoc sp. DedVER01b]